MGAPKDFIRFIQNNPQSIFANQAKDFLFGLLQNTDEKFPSEWLTDSLQTVVEINKLLWAPIYKNGKFGFINSRGEEMIAPKFEGIKSEYKCGSIHDDVLITSAGVVSRQGKILAPDSTANDIGFGFLKVGDSGRVRVLHKSGRWITDKFSEDASLLDGRFLLVKENGLTGLIALNGRRLLASQWTSIELMDSVLILDRNGKKTICTLEQLSAVADNGTLPDSFVFDKVISIGQGFLLVSNGSLEGIMNSSLEFEVPLSRQSLIKMPFGLVRKINDQYVINGLMKETENLPWDSFRFYKQWLLLKNAAGLKLIDVHSKKIIEQEADSLWFENGLAFARTKDSIRVHINSSSQIMLAKQTLLSFIKSPDSVRYFFTEQKNKKIIFSIETGEKLFATDADQIEVLTSDIFLITKKNKKGLFNRSGKNILPAEYDALILKDNDKVSLLKDKKFGLYDLLSSKLIKPAFQRNISLLDSATLIAFKDGQFGLIDWQTKPLTGFQFDEIQPWTKNEIRVKKDFEWRIFDFRQSKIILPHVKDFHVFKNTSEEKLAVVRQENYYGVFSSTRGMIIPTSFSTVINLGSEEEPLYFTSKEVEEANIVVVIYYNRDGKMLRKQVYEDDEYIRIACPDE